MNDIVFRELAWSRRGKTAIQQNDRRSFLPTFLTPVKPAIHSVVLLDFAWERRGKLEIPRPIKFNLCGVAYSGDKVRPVQKFERFVQSPLWLGRVFQPKNGVCHLKT